MDELTKMITSAVIAYIIPKALGSIGKTFTPAGSSEGNLPWVQWLIACFIGMRTKRPSAMRFKG